jgi:hypothetical protein
MSACACFAENAFNDEISDVSGADLCGCSSVDFRVDDNDFIPSGWRLMQLG